MDTPRAFALLTTLALAAPAAADFTPFTEAGELPRFETTVGDERVPLPLQHTKVRAQVSGFVARVEVTQTYGNPYKVPIEAVYVFPLPQNSAVDDFKLVIGGRHIEGLIQKRADARRTYEAARRAGRTAALLEQERPNIFTQTVANIAPGEKIDIVIRYVQTLVYDDGAYEFVFPMVVGPRYVPGDGAVPDAARIKAPVLPDGMRSGHDIEVEVFVDAALPIRDFETPTHDVNVSAEGDTGLVVRTLALDAIPNRDFVLRWWVDTDQLQAAVITHRDGRRGYFSLLLQPPRLDVDQLVGDRELIFVVDVSGSMTGLPIWLCQEAMRDALRRLRPGDTFNVITFAGYPARMWPEPRKATAANLNVAMGFVNSMKAGGGTEMLDAIDAALGTAPTDGRHRYVFFLTDGYVGNEAQIISRAKQYVAPLRDTPTRAKVFTFGVGSSVNRHLIDGVAEAGEGVAFYATNREDPARGVNQFFRVIDHAVLTDVRIDWGRFGVEKDEVYPRRIPDLFASRPVVVHGRFKNAGHGIITVSGRSSRGERIRIPIEVTLPKAQDSNGAVGSLWARAKVHEIQSALWDGRWTQKRADSAKEWITALGLRHRLVTRYTSFVAVDRSRKVGSGNPATVVQPVEVPEDVNGPAAGAVPVRTQGLTAYGRGASGKSVGLGVMSAKAKGVKSGIVHLNIQPAPSGSRSSARGGYGIGGFSLRGAGSGAGGVVSAGTRGRETQVSGSLARGPIQKVIRSHLTQIKRLYEQQLKKNPNLSGKIVLTFVIAANGTVKSVKVTNTTVGDKAFEKALMKIVKKWKFPKPAGGGEVVVSYPFVFESDT